jgi:hypothetical protein
MIWMKVQKLYGYWIPRQKIVKRGSMNSHTLNGIRCLLLCLALTTLPTFADATTVRVDIILAQNTNHGVDSRLQGLHRKLTRIFNFSSYRLVGSESVSPGWNQAAKVSLPNKGKLVLTPITEENGQVIIQAEIYRGSTVTLNTQFRIQPGGTILLNGPKTNEGQIILGLSLG